MNGIILLSALIAVDGATLLTRSPTVKVYQTIHSS